MEVQQLGRRWRSCAVFILPVHSSGSARGMAASGRCSAMHVHACALGQDPGARLIGPGYS